MRLELTQIDPNRNRARFYQILLEQTENGWKLIRRWGRIGSRLSEKIAAYSEELSAQKALERLIRQKCKRGYIFVDLAHIKAAHVKSGEQLRLPGLGQFDQ